MDIVVHADRIPMPGETVISRADFQMHPGGKGANQAFALARLGVRVSMIGRVGQDLFGSRLKENLRGAGVDVTHVRQDPSCSTGVAFIIVNPSGENAIAVASGANAALGGDDLNAASGLLAADFVLFQLETPVDSVHMGMRLAKENGARTVLDPAPATALSSQILSLVDILTPNEMEAPILLGESPRRLQEDELTDYGRRLLDLGASLVILKLGERGSVLIEKNERVKRFPAIPVKAVDSTAAGDIFNAALVAALAEGTVIERAIEFATRAAGISVTRMGAQPSAPTRGEVTAFVK